MTSTRHPSLLHRTDPREKPAAQWLRSAGGFLWWYVDFFDDDGNGVVLIWSYGLPFLPGERQGNAAPATQPWTRPSLNLVLYRGGREHFYLLQEYDPSQAVWSENQWQFGQSQIRAEAREGRIVVRASLDLAVPSSRHRLIGTVALDGPLAPLESSQRCPAVTPNSVHQWSLLTATAEARATLSLNGERFSCRSDRGYHDRNSSAAPLDRLGIRHWIWGRVSFSERELMFYLLWPDDNEAAPTCIAIEQYQEGRTRTVPNVSTRLKGRRLARYGMPCWRELVLLEGEKVLAEVSLGEMLDDGPFYLRARAHGIDASLAHGAGAMELCRPGRVGMPWLQPFVRMRVHAPGEDNSAWLPLFSGPRHGRAARQLSAMVSKLRARAGSAHSEPFAGRLEPSP